MKLGDNTCFRKTAFHLKKTNQQSNKSRLPNVVLVLLLAHVSIVKVETSRLNLVP